MPLHVEFPSVVHKLLKSEFHEHTFVKHAIRWLIVSCQLILAGGVAELTVMCERKIVLSDHLVHQRTLWPVAHQTRILFHYFLDSLKGRDDYHGVRASLEGINLSICSRPFCEPEERSEKPKVNQIHA